VAAGSPSGAGTTWFGLFARSCGGSSLWASINPAVGYSTGDGAVNDCVPDPLGSGQTVLEMRVTPQTCAWSCEQRLDWDSQHVLHTGQGYYVSIPIMVPVGGLPCRLGSSPGTGVMFNEQYGAPTRASPSNDLNVQNNSNPGACMQWSFSGNTSGRPGGAPVLWRGGLAADGRWHDFIEHIVLATSSAAGEIQIWMDGQPVVFNTCSDSSTLTGCGTATLHYPTVIPGATDSGDSWVQINNYRNLQGAYTTTLYHGAPAAGPSYSSVEQTLVDAPFGP
jgi:hypothetical protein